jgi:hypothetical protein
MGRPAASSRSLLFCRLASRTRHRGRYVATLADRRSVIEFGLTQAVMDRVFREVLAALGFGKSIAAVQPPR